MTLKEFIQGTAVGMLLATPFIIEIIKDLCK